MLGGIFSSISGITKLFNGVINLVKRFTPSKEQRLGAKQKEVQNLEEKVNAYRNMQKADTVNTKSGLISRLRGKSKD